MNYCGPLPHLLKPGECNGYTTLLTCLFSPSHIYQYLRGHLQRFPSLPAPQINHLGESACVVCVWRIILAFFSNNKNGQPKISHYHLFINYFIHAGRSRICLGCKGCVWRNWNRHLWLMSTSCMAVIDTRKEIAASPQSLLFVRLDAWCGSRSTAVLLLTGAVGSLVWRSHDWRISTNIADVTAPPMALMTQGTCCSVSEHFLCDSACFPVLSKCSVWLHVMRSRTVHAQQSVCASCAFESLTEVWYRGVVNMRPRSRLTGAVV